jgi:hypothetical protein
MPALSTGALPISDHDRKNTANVSAVLSSGKFDKVPGRDVIPLASLKALRLEDGIDATKKEEYLSAEEFEAAFGMDRGAWGKLPAWKRADAKKKVGLF